jgi:hypothetical protein
VKVFDLPGDTFTPFEEEMTVDVVPQTSLLPQSESSKVLIAMVKLLSHHRPTTILVMPLQSMYNRLYK